MAVTADKMKSQSADYGQFKQAAQKKDQAAQNNVNTTIDKSLNENRQGLTEAYNKNVNVQNEANTAGKQAYQTAQADVNVQANRNERNMNRFAQVRDLNWQPGSQQALQLNRARQTSTGNVLAERNRALEENARKQAMLKVQFQNDVNTALSSGEYRRAAALFDQWNISNNWLDENAANLMGHGNSMGYKMLYGKDPAKAMQAWWNGTNPEIAYNTGKITEKKYKKITGLEAPDKKKTDAGGSTNKKDYAAYYKNGVPHYKNGTTKQEDGTGDPPGGQ